jgi:hypothetical protein
MRSSSESCHWLRGVYKEPCGGPGAQRICWYPASGETHSALQAQFAKLHKMLLDLVRTDPTCRRLMTAPGVRLVAALTYRACVDKPSAVQSLQVRWDPIVPPRSSADGYKAGPRQCRRELQHGSLILSTRDSTRRGIHVQWGASQGLFHTLLE